MNHLQKMSRWLCLLCAFALMMGLAACGGSAPSESASATADMYNMASSAAASTTAKHEMGGVELMEDTLMTDGESKPEAPASTNRKLIQRVYLTMETLEFDQTMQVIDQAIAAVGGYTESSSIEGMGLDRENGEVLRGNRYANMVVRVPQAQLDAFLAQTEGAGTVTYRSNEAEDVTLRYVDLENRLESLQVEQERLMELLEQAASVDELIQVEARLSEVRYEIESLTSSLRGYDNLIDFATVNFTVREVRRITPVSKTMGERISTGFVETLLDIKDGAGDLVVWIAVNSPYLVIWAVVIALASVLVISQARRRRERREQLYQPVPTVTPAEDADQNPPTNA